MAKFGSAASAPKANPLDGLTVAQIRELLAQKLQEEQEALFSEVFEALDRLDEDALKALPSALAGWIVEHQIIEELQEELDKQTSQEAKTTWIMDQIEAGKGRADADTLADNFKARFGSRITPFTRNDTGILKKDKADFVLKEA